MLAVFDFDHTIVKDNSDIVARNMIKPSNLIPDHKNYLNDWTQYMQQVFDTMKNINIPSKQIIDAVSVMSPNKGMPRLMRALNDNNIDIIVASDSNSLFIHNWFERNKLSDVLSYVYTNSAKIEEGHITIKPYESQTLCDWCTKNMCKGAIIKEHILSTNKIYNKLFYFGDGKNDLCPVLKLNQNDIAFPRSGFVLDNLLKSHKTKATIIPWCTGDDIYEYLKSSKLI
ncbi:Phosphatase PHOSPHO-type,HAD-like domain,Pyridoxal phosphate phosphatase-related [Cinara cedri]|uniref:Phosphatase PHOSPHO-type,HAD-like domain,Pyridoxal phosphate phosphatase-related n=1 Tax=Cinara cedri TaxID=506608 RepID=A0A5E4NAB4_9HEMI|nr:Phosphatase PHOSPHO-type,HAD-like domain,Pyridoxal phosphate phosphatase-related [Cinara cedri]